GVVSAIGGDTLQFTIAPGSDVMCARISTYWVDTKFWLHRSDFDPAGGGATITGGNGVVLRTTNGAGDAIAPGLVGLQVADRFPCSAPGLGSATPEVGRWAYGPPGPPSGYGPTAGGREWFEVRRVRINMTGRALRGLDIRNTAAPGMAEAPAEDGPTVSF